MPRLNRNRRRWLVTPLILAAMFAPAALLWERQPEPFKVRVDHVMRTEGGRCNVSVSGINRGRKPLTILSAHPSVLTSDGQPVRIRRSARGSGGRLDPGEVFNSNATIPPRLATDTLRIGFSLEREPSRLDRLLYWLSRRFPVASVRVWLERQIGPNAVNHYTAPFVPAEVEKKNPPRLE